MLHPLTRLLKKPHQLILLIIIIISATIRFYRFPEMAAFDFDQQYASEFAYQVIQEYPIRMAGQGLSIMGLFMGPWYFYYLTPFFWLTNLHPLGGIIGSILFGILITYTYYYVGKKIFNTPTGLIAAFIHATNFYTITYDWSMVPSYHSALIVLITWYLFYQYWQGKTKTLPLLTFVLGMYTSIHPILFPFYLVFLSLLIIKRKLPNLKITILSLITFSLPITPLLAFEYFRKFSMTKQLYAMFTQSQNNPQVAIRLPQYFQQIYQHLQNTLTLNYPFLLIIIIIGLILLFLKKIYHQTTHKPHHNFHYIFLPLTFIIFLAYYSLFPGHVPEYYLLALYVLASLYLSAGLSQLIPKKINKSNITNYLLPTLLFLILTNLTYHNLHRLNNEYWSNPSLTTLYHKSYIVNKIISLHDSPQPLYISHISELGWDFGFPYLYQLYDLNLAQEPVPGATYTIVIPKRMSPDAIDISSGNIGLILPD